MVGLCRFLSPKGLTFAPPNADSTQSISWFIHRSHLASSDSFGGVVCCEAIWFRKPVAKSPSSIDLHNRHLCGQFEARFWVDGHDVFPSLLLKPVAPLSARIQAKLNPKTIRFLEWTDFASFTNVPFFSAIAYLESMPIFSSNAPWPETIKKDSLDQGSTSRG